MDKLDELFYLQEDLMKRYKERSDARNGPEAFPQWPVDMTKKPSQQFCKDVTLRGVEEMFEALQHLKNSKPHRESDVPDFDHEEFLEEIVDSFHYFIELLIMAGVTADELHEKYKQKNEKNRQRIKSGY